MKIEVYKHGTLVGEATFENGQFLDDPASKEAEQIIYQVLRGNHPTPQRLIDDRGTVDLYKGLFVGLFDVIREETPWDQQSLEMYGKQIPLPRLTAWYGEDEYTYSGVTNKPTQWTPKLLEIKEVLQRVTGETFNSCLLNLYRDGQDSVSWHSDDESELGDSPVIASISLGDPRKFQLKKQNEKKSEKEQRISVLLEDGDLLVMGGELQKHWLHQIPKTKRPVGPRINLTFRNLE